MNRIFLGVAVVACSMVATATLSVGCTKVETLPATVASLDAGAAAPLEASILPYDAALHPKADSGLASEARCFRAAADAVQARDVSAFGYHAPMEVRAACAASEVAAVATASAASAFTSLQYDGAAIAGLRADCSACLMAEYDVNANPPGPAAKWGLSGLRTDAAEKAYVLPSNRSWLNTFGCLERANVLSAAEARAAADATTCRSLFCPLGSGGCGLATSQEYASCTQFVEATGGPCAAVAAARTPFIAAKVDAALAAGTCGNLQSVAAVFCVGAPEPDVGAGGGDASVGQ